MSATHLLLALAALVCCEAGVFYVRHADVIRLSGTRASVVADAGFNEAAEAVLAREQVSRRVLERVADVAHERRAVELRVRALERIVAAVPTDGEARLRLAEALRDAGRLDEAEQLYRAELGLDQGGEQ
jgi:thioredoxin-like negative regulator of GroEL